MVHKPVLVERVGELLKASESGCVVDATCGSGGHSVEILERMRAEGLLVALDRDPEAVERTKERLGHHRREGWKVVHANYSDLEEVLEDCGIKKVDAVLFDLGVSSEQLEDPKRGFSFLVPGPLDMRMDPRQGQSAFEIVNRFTEDRLFEIFKNWGEERYSRRVAKVICRERKRRRFRTTRDLAGLIEKVIPRPPGGGRIHPATRIFQALRIAVNEELEHLERGLQAAEKCLAPCGRMAVISFHSLEDRCVKLFFRRGEKEGRLKILTPKPLTPEAEELQMNPRSRSAKLRAAEKMG